jgi:hypothetical protein
MSRLKDLKDLIRVMDRWQEKRDCDPDEKGNNGDSSDNCCISACRIVTAGSGVAPFTCRSVGLAHARRPFCRRRDRWLRSRLTARNLRGGITTCPGSESSQRFIGSRPRASCWRSVGFKIGFAVPVELIALGALIVIRAARSDSAVVPSGNGYSPPDI